MRQVEILDAIRDIARQHLGFSEEIQPGMRLAEDLGLDSLKSLTLAVEVENRFRVRLDPESEAQIVTVGDLIAVVGSKLDERQRDAE